MNNGKVRIYELSKELNLDNKDILEICAQLNIAVKSHSSTITESQAERIRALAERYTPSHVVGKSHGSPSPKGGAGSSFVKSSERPKGQRKEEILAIHHKHNHLSSTHSPKPSGKSAAPVLATPPQLPVQPQPPLQPKPLQVSRLAEPSPQLKEAPQQQIPQVKSQKVKAKEKVATAPSSEAPQLIGPPAKPTRETSKVKRGNQPIPKPVKKAEASTVSPKGQPTATKSPEESEKPTPEPVAKKQRKDKGQPKLQRPQRPKPARESKLDLEEITAKPEPELEEDGLEEETLLEPPKRPKPKLKRPTLTRQAKGKAWEEEDEAQEDQGKSGKPGKSSSKSKRRPQPVIEDDEDFESELETVSIPAAISLSIARPPKPKSHPGQTAASAASNANKVKRPTPKTDIGTTRTKSERRGERGVSELPEKIALSGNLTVRELSELLNILETEIVKKLFVKGVAINITQTLDVDTARLVAEELGVKVETEEEVAAAAKSTEMLDAEDLENLQRRPPVVTIMGHVDHGKTTLLDSIRKTKVAQGEAGGITQHIGAYHVDLEHGDKKEQIVFLDTPGHEAFTAMRARGARVTDIAVLVVGADDGVQPQTKEAISHAKAAEVPIVVAVNKIDKPGAEPDRVKQELTELDLVPEEWGGDTIMVPVSALKGENLDTLLEMILLVAELEEISANPDRTAKGTVIEANLDRTRGPVATLLVQNGTLRVGDTIVAGSVFGKIRAMIDDRGEKVEAAMPSFAVEVLGLSDVPEAGDEFEEFESEKEARIIAAQRAEDKRQSRLQQKMASRRVTLSSLSAQAQEGELKELNLILKADVQGSVEAILGALKELPQDEVQIRVLLADPGEITETDVYLAAASGAVIVGFNNTLASGARQAADGEGVDIREYNIIYKLLDDIQGAMEGLLDPEEVEEALGIAEVRAVFPVGRGAVAGCYVQSGKVVRNRPLRVRRGGQVIFEGTIDSLKRVKEDAREVNAGYECGIGVAKFSDWKEGDIIEAYEMVLKRRTLSVN
ncbi:MAG: translation initiation factor IF-2 [Xenococcaceae cyanobacterium]